MTLPSFFAAAISSGVIAVGGGAAAEAGEANTVLAATAPVALSTSRLENPESPLCRIARFLLISTFLLRQDLWRQDLWRRDLWRRDLPRRDLAARPASQAAPGSARAAIGARPSRPVG